MKFIKQKDSLSIRNLAIEPGNSRKRHSPLLSDSIRAIVVGPSNCGKTNLMIALIEHPNGLKFENIYIYSKSLHQPKYQYLQRVLSPINGLGYYTFSDNCDVISPEEAKPNSIFIFDDVACDKQNNIRSYFCMGRHSYIDSFYLCQTYTHIPKHLIRDNANLLILFKQDEMNLRHVYNDHVNTDMSFENFRYICAECWKDKYGFLVIDKDSSLDKGHFRKGFDTYIAL